MFELLANEHKFEVVPQYILKKFSKAPILIPLLFINGQIETSSFYFITEGEYKNKSFETMRQLARSVGLFLEFYMAMPETEREINTAENYYATILKINQISENFYEFLKKGSLKLVDDRDILTKPPQKWGYNGLLWKSKSTLQANKIMTNVERYLFFCATKLKYFHIDNEILPSIIKATRPYYNAYSSLYPKNYGKGYNKKYNFLSHLNEQSTHNEKERKIIRYSEPSVEQNPFRIEKEEVQEDNSSPSRCFPDAYIYKMLIDANITKKSRTGPLHEWLNVRNVMLYSAYLFQGRRLSEPLHSWTGDINIVDGFLQWGFFHPEKAPVPHAGCTREEYLLSHYGMLPLTKLKTRRIGWKGIAFNEPEYMVYFSTFLAPESITRTILPIVHRSYIENVRPKYMAKAQKDHPFYFVTKHGDPLSNRKAVEKIWRTSCRCIGLTGLEKYGQSIHCCRHRIKRLADLIFKQDSNRTEKVRAILGQISLPDTDDMSSAEKTRRLFGHRSIASQNHYGRKGMAEISKNISDAFSMIEKGDLSAKDISNEYIVHPMDPLTKFPETYKILEEYI